MMGRKCPGMPGCWGMPGSTAKPGDLGTPRYLGIENRPALEVIQRFDSENVFMYLDPPYLLSGRAAKQYRHEMSDADHEELLETILESRAKIMVSGYESEMYDSYLAGWRKEQFKSCAEHGGTRTETVWMNYSKGQMSMFEMMGGCDERFDH
ncbi:MAG: DNA adenine methylase [Lachnospiraceae bacterium]|nr:DNA adenine methylase [Lachnospiraceae bacterium]